MGVPLYRWMVDVMENPNLKWMMTGVALIWETLMSLHIFSS